ncbi:MAG: hypothetical protein Q9225_003189 [Loekoesia sp. 1 TL-2023]
MGTLAQPYFGARMNLVTYGKKRMLQHTKVIYYDNYSQADMKFGREYEATLKQENYPQHWIQSSISYRQLKKCIKKIQSELLELGLDAEKIKQLLRLLGSAEVKEPKRDPLPRLRFVVEIDGGELVGASLSPSTKETLQSLVGKGCAETREKDPKQIRTQHLSESRGQKPEHCQREDMGVPSSDSAKHSNLVSIEVPLKNYDEFFQILRYGLSGLNTLHDQEKTALAQDIGGLGQLISQVAAPSRRIQQTDLYEWRAIFGLYLDCNVFFSTSENESFNRSPAEVQNQLGLFSSRLDDLQKTNRFRRKDSNVALQRFLLINANLLRNLKFQQLNVRAAEKILKKFDKRTSLGAQNIFFSMVDSETFSTQAMAKSMCSQISTEVLAIVPQLNDYLCPICFSISYKPIRLRCGHVFCIRCMVVMQRSQQTHCPLCRGDVVMQADSANLDLALLNFLKTFFPAEVKQKQKDNERSAGVDQYGSDYEKCVLM